MENINIIYLILPFLLYSLQLAILAKYSRSEGSMQVAFYRQLGIALVGIPLFFFFPIDFNLILDNAFLILLTSLIGAIYLFLNFKSLDYLNVAVQNVLKTATRVLGTIIVGILFLSDKINMYQSIGIFVLLIGISTLLKKTKFNKIGISLSLLCGLLVVANWYYFALYSKNFNPIIAGYILEFVNGIFLFFLLIGKSFFNRKSIQKSFKIKKKSFLIILASAPLPLIGSSAIAKSYDFYSFSLVGIVLTMSIPASMLFGYFILKEKLSKKSILAIFLITFSIMLIKYFGE